MVGGRNGTGGPGRARVVLLGGKELAVRCLHRMLSMADIDVVTVIPCAADNPAEERWYPSLAGRARQLGLVVHQPRSVNDDGFLPVIERLAPDVLLSVFYDKILKPPVLAIARTAAVNLHFGLLPHNRGSFPIPWALIDGNHPGVTLHHMDPGVDTGDIIAQAAVPPAPHETARELYDRCTQAGEYLFRGYFPLVLRGEAPRVRQPAGGGSYYRPGYPFDRWVDWAQSAEQTSRFIRALTFAPYPAARTSFGGRELELPAPVWPRPEGHEARPGTVAGVAGGRAAIVTGGGTLLVEKIVFDGRELPAGEALRRAGCAEGDVLESRTWMRASAA